MAHHGMASRGSRARMAVVGERGLGRSIVSSLAQEGADVAFSHRDSRTRAETDEVVEAVLFLALSPPCTTGAILSMDGGRALS